MKIYIFFFVIFSLAEAVFSLCYFILTKKPDRIIILGAAIYLGGMFCGFIAYWITRYRKRRKELMDALP